MKLRRMFLALALAGAAMGSPALAQAAGQPLPAPYTAAQAMSLCPGLDGNPDAFGMERQADDAALGVIGARARALGLDGKEATYTSWSGKLFAIDFSRDVPSGGPLGEWRAPLDAALVADGWEPTEDGAFGFGAPGYLKRLATGTGARRYLIQIDLHGNRRGITLRCGDADLTALDADERDGVLAAGSPRPVPPKGVTGVEDFLVRFDCSDPELLALAAETENPEAAIAFASAKFGPGPDPFANGEYQSRLVTWLKWKLRTEGRLDDETIWSIEDKAAAADPQEYEGEFLDFVGALTTVAEADKNRDPVAKCRSMAQMLRVIAAQSEDEARRDAALAAALVEEAGRRGIALD